MVKKAKKTKGSGNGPANRNPTCSAVQARANSTTAHIPLEVVEMVLHHLPAAFLLSSAQRVCRLWRELVSRMPQTFLCGASATSKLHPPLTLRTLNPMLLRHFRPLFNDGTAPVELFLTLPTRQRYNPDHWLPDMTIAKTKGRRARAVREAFARRGATWRKMQICSPPIYQLRYWNEDESRGETATFEDGLRMGALYDLVVEIVTTARPNACFKAVISWTFLAELWDTSDDEDAEGDHVHDVQIDRVVTRFGPAWCYTKHSPGPTESCYKEYRERIRVRHISSVKWAYKCEEGGAESLVVDI